MIRYFGRFQKKYAQTMGMGKFKRDILNFKFLPKFINAKVTFCFSNIMKQDYSIISDFREPFFKIVTDRFVGVISINVKEINRIIFKTANCFIKCHS